MEDISLHVQYLFGFSWFFVSRVDKATKSTLEISWLRDENKTQIPQRERIENVYILY